MTRNQNRAGGTLAVVLASLFILLIVVAGAIFVLGYAKVDQTPGRTTVEINTEQLDKDTRQAVDSARRSLQEGAKSIGEGLDTDDEGVIEQDEEDLPQTVETTPDPEEPPREVPDDEI